MSTKTLLIPRARAIGFPILLYGISFIIPALFSSPQIITGTIINSIFFLAVHRLSKKEIIPLLFIPSLGALSHGILFGPQTMYLILFLPFIWMSNYVLTHLYSILKTHHPLLRIVIASSGKYAILQLIAYGYIRMHIVPTAFLVSLGYIQLITALFGGISALLINYFLPYERTRDAH